MTFADAIKSGPALVAWGMRNGKVTPPEPPTPVIPDRFERAAKLGICRDHVKRPVPVVPGKRRCAACIAKERKNSAGRKR